MNKIKVLLIFISILFSFLADGQEMKPALMIFGLNDSYTSSDNIVFTIDNQTDTIIFFSVAIQEKISNKWVRISQDIFQNEFSKTTTFLMLKKRESKEISWNTLYLPRISLNNQDDIVNPICGTFRFVIRYTNYSNSIQMDIYTKEFIISNSNDE